MNLCSYRKKSDIYALTVTERLIHIENRILIKCHCIHMVPKVTHIPRTKTVNPKKASTDHP